MALEDDCGIRPSPAVEMPSFFEQGPGWVDGWKPAEGIGDFEFDYQTGELYGDMAIRYARQIRDYQVLSFIIASIQTKALRGALKIGPIEQGFYARLCRAAYAGHLS